MKIIEEIKCETCKKKMIKKKDNHKFCSDDCRRKLIVKNQQARMTELRSIANDILKGRKPRSYLTKMGMCPGEKNKINNFIKSMCYGN